MARARSLRPQDAALLALAADRPNMSSEALDTLLDKASGQKVKSLIKAVVEKGSPRSSSAVTALRAWSERNKTVHKPGRKK